MSRHMHLKLA